jgi:hypothetical protein
MTLPDQLKKPVPTRHPDIDVLEDLLWEAASWDPDVERVIQQDCPGGTDRELIEATQRLLDDGLLTEPALAYRAMRLLARLGALGAERPAARVWPTAGGIGPGRVRDPMRISGPAAGPAAARTLGVQEALKRPGVRLLGITGPAGVGKTRLAADIAVESQRKIMAARRQETTPAGHHESQETLEEAAVPLLEISLRSAESGAGNHRLALAPYDTLLNFLVALGVPETDIPASLEGRRACYIARLRGREPVILIDDAIDESQVLPLLPPDDGVVVVTSRHSLPGLFAYGAVYPPLAALDAYGVGRLVRSCFEELGARPDQAVVTAIHDWCAGLPLPTILISRWMAATARAEELPAVELAARLDVARREWQRDRRDAATSGGLPAFVAVAAVFSLLGEDQQAVMLMLGLLRIPEADIRTVCIGAGLDQERALAALARLTEMHLLTRDESGLAWTTAPAVADYARGWALASGQRAAVAYEQMLGSVIGLHQRRAEALRDLQFALAERPGAAEVAGASQWGHAEWAAARDVHAALLDAAAATEKPAQAGRLAAAYLAEVGGLDQRETDWRETERYVGPVLPVARAAGDHRLEAKALLRLGHDAARQGDDASAVALVRAAAEAEFGDHATVPGSGTESTPEPGLEPGKVTSGTAEPPAARNGLERVVAAVSERGAAPAGPLLFGARA